MHHFDWFGPKTRITARKKITDRLVSIVLMTLSANHSKSSIKPEYRLSWESRGQNLKLKIMVRQKPFSHFERFGFNVLKLEKAEIDASPLDLFDFQLVRSLLGFARFLPTECCFLIPKKQAAFFLSRLSKFEEIEGFSRSERFLFSKNFFKPTLVWISTDPNGFSLELESSESAPEKTRAFFKGTRSWFLKNQTFSPISQEYNFLEAMDAQGKIHLLDQAALDFMREDFKLWLESGRLQFKTEGLVPELIEAAPSPVYALEERPETGTIRLRLEVRYQDWLLPLHEEVPEVFESRQKDGKIFWIPRDFEFEQTLTKQLQEAGFTRVSPHFFEIRDENALDFANRLSQGHFLESIEDASLKQRLMHFKILGRLGKKNMEPVLERTADGFRLGIHFLWKNQKIPFLEMQHFLRESKSRYWSPDGQGFAELEREALEEWMLNFEEIGLKFNKDGNTTLKPYHLPYLAEIIPFGPKALEYVESLVGTPAEEPLPTQLNGVLRPYQKQGYDWLLALHHKGFHPILADDMGLGKTIQTLAFFLRLKECKDQKPNLVVAPASVVFNWVEEAKQFTPDLKVLLLTGAGRKDLYDQIAQSDLVLTNYALLRRDLEILKKQPFRAVVLDEAQFIKNVRSQTSVAVRELVAEQRIALTGTPLENHLSELWSLFHFLMPNFLGNATHFKNWYQKPIEERKDELCLQRLKKRVKPFILRRQKSEVANELPPKTEIDQYCEMTPEQREIYESVLRGSRKELFEAIETQGFEKSRFSILTSLLRLRQICCHPQIFKNDARYMQAESGKLKVFEDLLEEILSEGHRVIVFSQFVEMLQILKKTLDQKQVAYAYLDGRTQKRQQTIADFQNNAAIPVFLISLKAGGTGLNLTGADYVIHYDPWWNPAVESQATDRVHRIGQLRHVFSYRLVTRNSVEEKILLLQKQKKDLFRGLFETGFSSTDLSVEDLDFLFS